MPVLTSSTESFRSGLTTYAQLQAPRNNSPQKATKVHVPCAPLSASWHAAPAVSKVASHLAYRLAQYTVLL